MFAGTLSCQGPNIKGRHNTWRYIKPLEHIVLHWPVLYFSNSLVALLQIVRSVCERLDLRWENSEKPFVSRNLSLADKTSMFFNASDDPCENYLCLNGGTCLVEDGPYCSCQEMFSGGYCDTYKAGKEINYRVCVS